jgi:hypothetical protein
MGAVSGAAAMTISVTCSCGATYRLKPEAVGKKFQCRECDEVLTVQAPARQPQPARRPQPPVDEYGDDVEDYDDYENHEDIDKRPSRGGERIQSGNGRHSIVMKACDVSIEAITPKRLQHACDELLKYLAASPDAFKRSEIRLSVRSTVRNDFNADVQIRMSGTLNGRPVDRTFEGFARDYGAGTALDERSWDGGQHRVLQQEFVNVRYKMFAACDKAVGRKASKATGRWKAVQIAALVAGPVAFLLFFAFTKMRGESALTAIMSGALVIVPIAFGVLAAGLTLMPDSFFLREAAGRRAMRLSGGNSPNAARIIGGITAVLMLALAVGLVILYVKLGNK